MAIRIFIFVNRFGECQHHSTINKGIDRIIRDCNEEQLAKCESGTIKPKNLVLLPKFSCHPCGTPALPGFARPEST